MTSVRIVLSTIDDDDSAKKIARQLVKENLAACVNIIPKVLSVYKWEGKIEKANESLLVMKTSLDRLESLSIKLEEIHPYDVPEILVLAVDGGGKAYLDWVLSSTTDS